MLSTVLWGSFVAVDLWKQWGVTMGALRFLWSGTVRICKWLRRRWKSDPVTFGGARFLTQQEAHKSGLLGSTGLVIGKLAKTLLRFADAEGSVVVFAPQGSGKGVGIVVPNLLSYPGSVICTDPKGENHAITGRARAGFGAVYGLDVAHPELSHRFNPLDVVRRDDLLAVDDCRRLAELLMPKDGREEDDHWRKRSVSVLTGVMLYVLERYEDEPDRCNLATVDAILAAPLAELVDTLKGMMESRHMFVRSAATRLATALKTEEGLNLLSNISKGTEIWGEGRVLGRLGRRSDFDLERDVVGRVASLFIIVPEDMQAVYAPFMRVMVGLSLHAVARVGKQGVGTNRPLFMLDEAAALGPIPELEEGMGHLRAYARAIMVFQDLGQLQAIYRKWRSLLANASCQIAFGVNDEDTAELFSKMLGDRTVEVRSTGVNTGASTILAHHENAGLGEAGRRLMQPSEILRMSRDEALVFMRGLPHPILSRRVKYYEEDCFDGLWDRWRDGQCLQPTLLLEDKRAA
jgi:type IV secretion system protein VirD4